MKNHLKPNFTVLSFSDRFGYDFFYQPAIGKVPKEQYPFVARFRASHRRVKIKKNLYNFS